MRSNFAKPDWSRCLCLALSGFASVATGHAHDSRVRLLFDDYYQKPRPEGKFDLGVARGGKELRDQSNFYLPSATAIPNGTFSLAQVLSDKFSIGISNAPLSEDLLRAAGGYLLVCPVRQEFGGRASLGSREADVLERFVHQGGLLALVANSVPDPAKNSLDVAGLNIIAGRFGARFETVQSETMSIPVRPDHPVMEDVGDVIFGNGTTIAVVNPRFRKDVLLESHHPQVPGVAAMIVHAGKGRVLLLGDAGTLGNAHVVRSDVDQVAGLRRMFLALLPDGPAARYALAGAQLEVRVREEQVVSGYPEHARLLQLPARSGAQAFASGMRQLDLEAGGARPRAGNRDFVSVAASSETRFTLESSAPTQGASDGHWSIAGGGGLRARLLPSGRFVAAQVPDADLAPWQHLLLREVILPLRHYAVPGERWSEQVEVPLPNVQLALASPTRKVNADVVFEGEVTLNGTPCYLFRQTTHIDALDWSPAELVERNYGGPFVTEGIAIVGGGQLTESRFWVSRETHLPVRTEIESSASLWWRDHRFPGKYIGGHDSKNYENWANITFVLTHGRKITADFAQRR